jgi:hypothetical protein
LKKIPFLLLLVFSSAPALRAGGTFPFSAPPRTAAAAFVQAAPVVASNGATFFSAWTTLATPYGYHVYATPLGPDGTPSPALPTPLDPQAASSYAISVSAARDGYFASWISEAGINAAIFDSFGRIEQRSVVKSSPDPERSARTLTAWNGAVHLVISGFNGPIVGTTFDDNGNPIQSGIDAGSTNDSTVPALVADSSGFLLLATRSAFAPTFRSDIYGRRFTSTGPAGDWFLVRSVASAVSGLGVSYDGTHDVIVWSDSFGLWTMSLDPQHAVSGQEPSRQLSGDPSAVVSRVIQHQGRTWIGWSTPAGDQAAPLNDDGALGDALPVGPGFRPDLASNGAILLAVRSAQPRPPQDVHVYGRVVSSASSDVLISRSETDQGDGDLAQGPDGQVLAVWSEQLGDGDDVIFVNRLGPDRLVPGPGIRVSGDGLNSSPVAAFNGTNYLVVWMRRTGFDSAIVGRRLSADGVPLDSSDIVLAQHSGVEPAIASDGDSWLVLWGEGHNTPVCGAFNIGQHMKAARVDASGAVLDPGGKILSENGFVQTQSAVTWTGSAYLAAWTNLCPIGTARVATSIDSATLAGDLSRVEERRLSALEATTLFQFDRVGHPVLAAGADSSLIAWQRNGGVTEFRVLDNAPPASLRRRRIAGDVPAVVHSVPGSLTSASATTSGEFHIFTLAPVPAGVPLIGFFDTTVGRDRNASAPRFLFGETTLSVEFLGHVVNFGGSSVITERVFDVAAGSRRLLFRFID